MTGWWSSLRNLPAQEKIPLRVSSPPSNSSLRLDVVGIGVHAARFCTYTFFSRFWPFLRLVDR